MVRTKTVETSESLLNNIVEASWKNSMLTRDGKVQTKRCLGRTWERLGVPFCCKWAPKYNVNAGMTSVQQLIGKFKTETTLSAEQQNVVITGVITSLNTLTARINDKRRVIGQTIPLDATNFTVAVAPVVPVVLAAPVALVGAPQLLATRRPPSPVTSSVSVEETSNSALVDAVLMPPPAPVSPKRVLEGAEKAVDPVVLRSGSPSSSDDEEEKEGVKASQETANAAVPLLG